MFPVTKTSCKFHPSSQPFLNIRQTNSFRFSYRSSSSYTTSGDIFYCSGSRQLNHSSFLFFSPAFSEFPRPIALKLCHMVGIWPNFIMQVQKLEGHSPQKIWGQKQANFGRFWTTSDLDREYLRNG